MMQIRPISDLRNRFFEIETTVKAGQPVYLTKNGYGSVVVLSLEEYSRLKEAAANISSERNAAALNICQPES